jgi:hypothetical protein
VGVTSSDGSMSGESLWGGSLSGGSLAVMPGPRQARLA